MQTKFRNWTSCQYVWEYWFGNNDCYRCSQHPRPTPSSTNVKHRFIWPYLILFCLQFTGRWFEVSRFPSDVQQGECFTTKYSLNGTNELSVARSFVFNERQINSTTGATVSPDGRGIISANISGGKSFIIKIIIIITPQKDFHYFLMKTHFYRLQYIYWK